MPQIPWQNGGLGRGTTGAGSLGMTFPNQDVTGIRDASSTRMGAGYGNPGSAMMAGAPGGINFPNLYVNTPGYDNSAAIRAMYDQLQNRGRKIYRKTKGNVRDIYGDLIEAYTPLQENTGIRYDTAISGANEAQNTRISEGAARNAEQDAARRAQMERMGVAGSGDTGSGGESVDVAREKGIADTQAVMANWQGLMGAQNAAQQGRDASTLRGASDQKRMAMEELTSRWSDYQNQLAQREAQAMQGARGGGGQQLNPIYAGMPELANIARMQQFANQTGMSVDQVQQLMGGQNQGPNPMLQEMDFNSLADLWDQYQQGGAEAKRASDYRKSQLVGTDFYAQ